MDQTDEQLGQVRRLDAVVDGDAVHGVGRHARARGVDRILHHGNAARLLDRLQARRAVVERSARDDADDARTVVVRRRPERRIDGRPVHVLARTAFDRDAAAVHVHLHAGRRDVDASGADWLGIDGVSRRQQPGAVQDGRQQAGRVRSDMQDDEQRRRQGFGELADETCQDLDPAARRADDDDVVARWRHRIWGSL